MLKFIFIALMVFVSGCVLPRTNGTANYQNNCSDTHMNTSNIFWSYCGGKTPIDWKRAVKAVVATGNHIPTSCEILQNETFFNNNGWTLDRTWTAEGKVVRVENGSFKIGAPGNSSKYADMPSNFYYLLCASGE